MPTKVNRFHGSREVTKVLRKGRAVRAEGFGLRLGIPGKARSAIVISKKVHKHAVVRNRIRRRIIEIIRELRQQQSLTDDIVFIVKDVNLATDNHAILKQKITHTLERKQ